MTSKALKAWVTNHGFAVARSVFAKRGDHSEVHMKLDELSALMTFALESGVEKAVAERDREWSDALHDDCPAIVPPQGPHEVGEWLLFGIDRRLKEAVLQEREACAVACDGVLSSEFCASRIRAREAP